MSDNRRKSLHGRTLALAGLYQATLLVQQTAFGLPRDHVATHTSIDSIFNLSPADIDDVYHGSSGLQTGLAELRLQLGNDGSARDVKVTAYALTLLHLERKLARQPAMLNAIRHGIEAIQAEHDRSAGPTAEVVAALASIYTDTISTLTPRIMVQGEPGILESVQSRDMIRALLLAGIRAAVLWRQCGGSRFQLVFQRNSLLEHARHLETATDRGQQ